MKSVLVGITILASSALLDVASTAPLSSESAVPGSASGQGSMHFGEHGDGVGTFVFDVRRDTETTGSFLFGSEEDHGFPDVVVCMERVNDAVFAERSVEFSGEGMLHDDPVFVIVSAFDGKGTETPDRFAIECTDSNGKVVFKAQGDLFIGDIVVGDADERVPAGGSTGASTMP